jgi:hypothetical protein
MMKDNQAKHIIEDLLPLYEEGLLSAETTAWLEEQAKNNIEYANLLELSSKALPNTVINSSIDSTKMFQQINRKLAMYQIIFVALSFLLAINTSLLNESFGFVLWYAVLGVVSFLFYKDFKIVLYLSLLPIFFWSVGTNIIDYFNGHYMEGITILEFLTSSLFGSLVLSVLHFAFALIGALIAWIILKLIERD